MQKKNIPVLALVGFVVDGALEVPWWKDHIYVLKINTIFILQGIAEEKSRKLIILFSNTDKEKKMAINGNSMTMKSLIEVYLYTKEIAFNKWRLENKFCQIPVSALVGSVVDVALEVPWWKDHICIKNKNSIFLKA